MEDPIPGWDELSGSAKDTLKDLAELFHDRGHYSVRIEIAEGGKRDFRAETTPSQLRNLRNGKR